MTELKLASEFPTPAKTDWLALVEQSLKGADFDKKLVSSTYDGIRIQPLYTLEDETEQVVPATSGTGPWRIAQAHASGNPADTNETVLESLEGGATAVVLEIAHSPIAAGLQAWTVDDLEQALKGVDLAAVPVHLSTDGRGITAAALYAGLIARKGIDAAALEGSLGIDPLGTLARSGTLTPSFAEQCSAAAAAHETAGAMRVCAVSTQVYHAAGCSEAQELGIALGSGVALLRGFEAAGLSLADAAKTIRFSLTCDADVFLTIAKFRAWRALWSRVLAACGIEGVVAECDAETATRMLTRRDPWVNMLRATAATFAAATGGARTITVDPFTRALGASDAFARRIARNCQIILAEESHIGQVADAARGSWYLETLTGELTAKAWEIFQDIEAGGGVLEGLTSGTLDQLIASVRDVRTEDIAKRKLPITGVSEFPKLDEEVPALGAASSGQPTALETAHTWEELLAVARAGGAPALEGLSHETCTLLPPLRLSEAFEAFRDASDHQLETTGKRPSIFLAHLGGPADYTARTTFARNLFEAGGVEAIVPESSTGDLMLAFDESGAEIACICSSDTVYETHAKQTATDLKGAGATMVFIAGRPGSQAEMRDLEDAGVDEYIFQGCNVVEILEEVHTHLKVQGEV